MHQAFDYGEPRSPPPRLNIAAIVADQAAAGGFRRLGLTGTRWLVESDVYPDKLTARGLEYVRPTAEDRAEIGRIIMDELVNGVIRPGAVAYFQQAIERLKSEGCDAVILGCTEIPLLMNDANSPLPTLDSTRLLARAALRRSVSAATHRLTALPAQIVSSLNVRSIAVYTCYTTPANCLINVFW